MDKRDPATGAAVSALSAARNKKLVAAAGGILLAVGIAGMVIFGSQTINKITTQGFSNPEEGKAAQGLEYVFLFTLLGGLILIIYAGVSYQREKSKMRQSRTDRTDAA